MFAAKAICVYKGLDTMLNIVIGSYTFQNLKIKPIYAVLMKSHPVYYFHNNHNMYVPYNFQ